MGRWWRRALVAAGLATVAAAPPLAAQGRGADAAASPSELEIVEVRGAAPGPTLALVAGVHGGKVAAIRALQQVRASLDTAVLRGRVLLVPVANAAGYRAGLAQAHPADGLNLNRVFPGRADGSVTERIADRLMREIVAQSDYLVDLHGSDGDEAVGSFAYAARPGLDERVDQRSLLLAAHWGSPRIVWDREGPRTLATSRFLQTAAHLSGVPAITVFEAGETRESDAATTAFVRGVERVIDALGMRQPAAGGAPAGPLPLLHSRRDVTLASGPGLWTPLVRPGQSVARGELLGTLAGSYGVPLELRAPVDGVVLHQRLAGDVAAQVPLVILADGPGSRDLPD